MDLPPKKVYVHPYRVKGHYRTIYARIYKFICAHCNCESKRTTYATTCPKYCDNCKDIKHKLGKKKQPNPIRESVTRVNPANLKENEIKDVVRTKSQAIELIRQANLKAAESTAKSIDKNSANDSSSKLPKTRINSEELIEFVNELFLDTRSNKLNSDERCIIVDLWHQRSVEEIAKKRNFKVKAVKAIQNNLMKQLTQDLKETVTPDNFLDVMTKHCCAYAAIKQST